MRCLKLRQRGPFGVALAALLLMTLIAQTGAASQGGPQAGGPQAGDPNLAGTWILDSERSDSPQRASRRALRDVERVLQPRGNAPQPSGMPPAQRPQNILAPLTPPRERVQIDLDLEAGEAVFRFDDRAPRRHYTDGRAGVIDSTRPQVGFAAWEGDRLYVEHAHDGGTRIIEEWRLEADRLAATYEVRNSLFSDPIRFVLRFRRDGARP